MGFWRGPEQDPVILLCREARLLNSPPFIPEGCRGERLYPWQPGGSEKAIINHWARWRAPRSTYFSVPRLFQSFPTCLMLFFFAQSLQPYKHRNISERYLQSQASKWRAFPCDLLTLSISCGVFFYVMSLQNFFLCFCSLNTAIPMLTLGKFTFGCSATALWEQYTSYLAQVPNPVNHSLTWQHRALGKLNTLLSCKDDFKFPLTPGFNQANYAVSYYHAQNEGICTFHHIETQQTSLSI